MSIICLPIIDKEISREDFITNISKYNANFVAPLKRSTSVDMFGCPPEIYDAEEISNANNSFIDMIVNNIISYSKTNNAKLVVLTKHDMYTRPPTSSETRINLRRLLETLKPDEIEKYRFKEGSIPNGKLIKDTDGTLFDYDFNHRMIKSVFSTAIANIKSKSAVTPVMDALVNNVNMLAQKVLSDNDISRRVSLSMIPGDYMLFDVIPNIVRSYIIPQSAYANGYNGRTSFLKKDYHLTDKIKDLKSVRDKHVPIFKTETEGYNAQQERGDKLSLPPCFDIDKRIN
jgi:hypothetical protein